MNVNVAIQLLENTADPIKKAKELWPNDPPQSLATKILRYAAKQGLLEIVKLHWEWENTESDWDIMKIAAAHGHMPIVKYCKKMGYEHFNDVMEQAAGMGHFDIVKQCYEWGATRVDWVLSKAALTNNTIMFKWSIKNGATNFYDGMRLAALKGYIDMVLVCKELGVTNYNFTLTNAIIGGYIEIVKLCVKWGVTDMGSHMYMAKEEKQWAILEFLKTQIKKSIKIENIVLIYRPNDLLT
jgi:hypothetical protein